MKLLSSVRMEPVVTQTEENAIHFELPKLVSKPPFIKKLLRRCHLDRQSDRGGGGHSVNGGGGPTFKKSWVKIDRDWRMLNRAEVIRSGIGCVREASSRNGQEGGRWFVCIVSVWLQVRPSVQVGGGLFFQVRIRVFSTQQVSVARWRSEVAHARGVGVVVVRGGAIPERSW